MQTYKTIEEAEDDCLKLWKYLAISGAGDKEAAVKKVLGKEGLLLDCPLCEYDSVASGTCLSCTWPGEYRCRCVYDGYRSWGFSPSRSARRRNASHIYQKLKKAFAERRKEAKP
jgi:hypothetical protein